MDMDKIIENMVNGRYEYAGFLAKGLFGDQLNSFFTSDGEIEWWGVLLAIILGAIVAGVPMAAAEDEDLGIKLRCMIATMLLTAILTGTQGYIFICAVIWWAVYQICLLVQNWL